MAIDFTSGTGHLFNRLGAVFYAIEGAQTYQGTTIPARVSNVTDEYLANLELIPTIQGTQTQAQSQNSSLTRDMANIATNTLIQMVQADNPQPVASLDYALPEIIAQMTTAGATVEKNVVSASSAAGTNTGTGTLVVSVVDGTGTTMENVVAEVLTVTCTADSQPGQGTTAGQEQFAARGDQTVDKLDFTWPKGSGGQTQITVASAAVDATTQNALTNSDFETFTVANTPDSWTISTGSAGTTVKSTTTSYIGAKALEIAGNGSELTRLTQSLRSSTVPGILQPQSKWCLAFYSRVSAVPSAGVLRVALKDAAGGSVVGTAISVTLSGETTSYALHSTTMNLPKVLPTNLLLVIELTTALDNAKSVYVDEVVLTQMVQHQNGPFMAIIPGSTNFIRGDVFNVTVANNGAGKFQTWFNRIFDMDRRHLVLPSATSGAETIPDSLIA